MFTEFEKQYRQSARTSMARSAISAPLQHLLKLDVLKGSILNFGSGRADIDDQALKALSSDFATYDFNWKPNIEVLRKSYDNVFCAYVVNVLEPEPRYQVYKALAEVTKRSGCCYIAARTDSSISGIEEFDGVRTSINTFQRKYTPRTLASECREWFRDVNVIYKNGSFCLVACRH